MLPQRRAWQKLAENFRSIKRVRWPGEATAPCQFILHFIQPPFNLPSSAGCGRSSEVEHNLAKVGVVGSNPIARSILRLEISINATAEMRSARNLLWIAKFHAS